MHCVGPSLAITALLSAAACGEDELPPAPTQLPDMVVVEIDAGAGSQTPNFGAAANGMLALTWQQPTADDGHALRFVLRTAAGWTQAQTIVESSNLMINWADFPTMLPLSTSSFVATWLAREGDGYGVRSSVSSDAGRTWSPGSSLHQHTGGPEYGFVSWAAHADGHASVFWLDGRESKGHEGGAMQLRGADVSVDGVISRRRRIDRRVCDCCQTSATATPAGAVVVYRDRSVTEVRDIVIVGPGAQQRRRVASDEWTIAGCPVNGPAVAGSESGALAVAWYTGAAERPTVRVAFGGADGPFGKPIDVDLGNPVGRVDVVWLDDARALVTFVESAGEGDTRWLARVVAPGGFVGPAWILAPFSAARASGFPRLERMGDRLVFAWTVGEDEARRVQVSTAPISSVG